MILCWYSIFTLTCWQLYYVCRVGLVVPNQLLTILYLLVRFRCKFLCCQLYYVCWVGLEVPLPVVVNYTIVCWLGSAANYTMSSGRFESSLSCWNYTMFAGQVWKYPSPCRQLYYVCWVGLEVLLPVSSYTVFWVGSKVSLPLQATILCLLGRFESIVTC